MYIIFNDKGVGDLYYYAEPLPKEHEKRQYVKIDEKDIPEKEGYTAIAKLIDGELEWEFEKIKEDAKLDDIEKIKRENELLQLAITEMALANEERTEETELAIAELTNLIGEVL